MSKQQKIAFIVLCLVFLLNVNAAYTITPMEQSTAELPPSDDTYISSNSPNQIFGFSSRVGLRNGSDINYDIRTLIQFNLSDIPIGTHIHYAHIYLYFYFYNPDYGSPAGRPYTVYRLTEPWNEETVCWNNQPNSTADATDYTYCPNETGQWIDWNVTSDVQAFLNGTFENYGWIIADETSGTGELPYAVFLSKEDEINHPYLLVDVDINFPPLPASNPYPEDGHLDLPGNTDISWVGNDPNVGENLTFDVYFGNTSPPPLLSNNQSATTYDLPRLHSYCYYYWRIDTWDSHREFAEGFQWHFRTNPNKAPSIPEYPSPPLGAANVNLTPILAWSACTDGDGDPVLYDVYLGTTTPPPLVSINQTSTTFCSAPLSCATKYYWRIIAHDDYGGYTKGSLWFFTTIVNHFPDVPVISGPTQGEIEILYNYTAVATDSENQSLSYEVDWGDGIVDPWYGPIPSGTVMNCSHEWLLQGSFTIKVRAKDTAGAISDWGYLTVTMPFSYEPPHFRLIKWLLERFPDAFPILRSLLDFN
ncbi:MAG TPA: DNRLRE domain-containing protein [Thermoplasmata archaeon]|nr:DNRLRE domain-containing protein [Thermoplasmata archaeon]